MKYTDLTIRHARPSDLPELQRLFVDTIKSTCNNDYTPPQIKAWTSSIENIPRWTHKLASQYFLIAEIKTQIVGFASLEHDDYFDFLYVHKDYQNKGIAGRLYFEIEKEALKRNATGLFSDVSITARPFFEKRGFKVVQTQVNLVQGVEIINYKMIKRF